MRETPEKGIMLGDFEGEDYGTWTSTGNAFGSKPSQGTAPAGQTHVSGFLGKGLVNTFDPGGDAQTGTLTSADFTIENDYIYFLIGGGNIPNNLCLNLIIDGLTVKTATGNNNEELVFHSWDVSIYKGQTAKLQIVDNVTGGWGHLNIDNIINSNEKIFLENTTIINDFESASYGNWTTTGTAFGSRPSLGAAQGQSPVAGYNGDRLVNTFIYPHGDGAVYLLRGRYGARPRRSAPGHRGVYRPRELWFAHWQLRDGLLRR